MRVVVEQSVSLDGIARDPGRLGTYEHRGWTIPFWNEEVAGWHTEQLLASDALLLGRVTYEEFVRVWPNRQPDEGRPGLRAGDGFVERMNDLPKLVASTTLSGPLEWNSTLIEGDPATAVPELGRRPGGDLLVLGSGRLSDTLRTHDLVDEYRLLVYPVVLGRGPRFLAGGGSVTRLALRRTETSATGVTLLVYGRSLSTAWVGADVRDQALAREFATVDTRDPKG